MYSYDEVFGEIDGEGYLDLLKKQSTSIQNIISVKLIPLVSSQRYAFVAIETAVKITEPKNKMHDIVEGGK